MALHHHHNSFVLKLYSYNCILFLYFFATWCYAEHSKWLLLFHTGPFPPHWPAIISIVKTFVFFDVCLPFFILFSLTYIFN